MVPKSIASKFHVPFAMTSVVSGLCFLTTYSTTSRSILVRLQKSKQIQGHESTSKLSTYSDFSKSIALKFHNPLAMTSIAFGLCFSTTYSTTSRSILVSSQKSKQIQGRESTSKRTAYSDLSQVHCFEIP